MDMSFEQRVRERAYEIWVAAGMQDGMAHEHWCAAEADVKTAAPETRAPEAAKQRTAKAAAKPRAKAVGTKAITRKTVTAKTATRTVAKPARSAQASAHLN